VEVISRAVVPTPMSSDDPFGQIERVVEQLADVGLTGGGIALDVIEREDAVVVTADLPGYDSGAIDVQLLEGGRLEISAERSEERESSTGTVHRSERQHEAVSRTVSLPAPVDAEATEASYTDGVLTVTLPKLSGSDEGTSIDVS
jgi:HSP20 family protein